MSAGAQAQTTMSNAELAAQIRQMQAQLTAMQAQLDAQTQSQQAAQAQLAAAQAKVDQVAAVSASAQARIETIPTQVKQAVADAPKPKSWTDSTVISGRMYFNLSSIDQTLNGDRVAPSGVGLDLKRFYLGVDHRFNAVYSANLTTDVQYASAISSTELFVKKAYLQANYSDLLNLRIGAADLPWVPFAEDLYGYRYIESVVTDRTKFGTSADWGLHAYGRIGPYLSYAASVLNGAGHKAPLRSKTMDFEGRVSAKVGDVTVGVGGYTGKLGRDVEGANNIFHTASRFNAIAAYVHGPVRLGVEYFTASNWNNVITVAGDKSEGYSTFASYAFSPRISVFGRYDWVKPRQTTSPTMVEDYFNLGVQYTPVAIVNLSLVYKRDEVERGQMNTANGVIGGGVNGTYDEVGLFGQLRW